MMTGPDQAGWGLTGETLEHELLKKQNSKEECRSSCFQATQHQNPKGHDQLGARAEAPHSGREQSRLILHHLHAYPLDSRPSKAARPAPGAASTKTSLITLQRMPKRGGKREEALLELFSRETSGADHTAKANGDLCTTSGSQSPGPPTSFGK